MQLDKTEIVIRQRTSAELMDLSLVVLRRHYRQIIATSALIGLPLLVLDVLTTSWMLSEQTLLSVEYLDRPRDAMQWRHAFHMFMLYVLQFPLVSLPTTVFLGNQIFFEPISIRTIIKKLLPISGRCLWVLGVLRLGILSLSFEFLVRRTVAWDWLTEFWLLLVLGTVVLLVRASFPYAPEILGLELCPLRSNRKGEITYRQRSRSLHGLLMADHVARFVGAGIFAGLLSAMLLACAMFGKGVLTGDWMWNDWFNYLFLPATMWIVGLFFAVYRFLTYLDSRIRLEGWEIELRLKAEANRLRRNEVTPDSGNSQEKEVLAS